MKRRNVLFLASAVAFLAAWAAADQEVETDFVRFVEGAPGEGKLETAVVTYGGGAGLEVDLIAAVHIADPSYYKDLERRFAGYDCVLYEMIKARGVEVTPGERSSSMLSIFQRGLKDMLGLEFQLDAIDYRRKYMVHADLDPDTFLRLQQEKGESIVTLLFKSMFKNLERQASGKGKRPVNVVELIAAFASRDSQRSLKLLFARELEEMEMIVAGFEGGGEKGESVLLGERNKAALKALRGAVAEGKKKIAIFYGGGHMPDLEKRLRREFGLSRGKSEWVTAWDIRKAPEEAPEESVPEPAGKRRAARI